MTGVFPFIIGLLVGFIIKRAVKLIFMIVALIIVLAATGYVSLTFEDIYGKAMEFLPKIIETGTGFTNVLSYSSATFLIGLALGLWKGWTSLEKSIRSPRALVGKLL